MDGNWKPIQPDAGMGPSMDAAAEDWRTQLSPEARQRIINKIMETLKRHLPVCFPEGLDELRKIAIRFEEKIYTAATSQSDYLRKISLKMLSMETKTQQSAQINLAMSNPGAVSQNPTYSDTPSMRLGTSENRSTINCENSSISEHESSTKRRKFDEPVTDSSHEVCTGGTEERKETPFSCPICLCTLTSPFSTICGHIFCENCIKTAIRRRKECPTCRRKLRGKNSIHSVYLPSAD